MFEPIVVKDLDDMVMCAALWCAALSFQAWQVILVRDARSLRQGHQVVLQGPVPE